MSQSDLAPFIARCHEAIAQQSQGRPEPFLDLWSHAEDVTIMAGLSGEGVVFYREGDMDEAQFVGHVRRDG